MNCVFSFNKIENFLCEGNFNESLEFPKRGKINKMKGRRGGISRGGGGCKGD